MREEAIEFVANPTPVSYRAARRIIDDSGPSLFDVINRELRRASAEQVPPDVAAAAKVTLRRIEDGSMWSTARTR